MVRWVSTKMIRLMLSVLACTTAVYAIDVEPVGFIDDNLHAPTSIDVSEYGIAILEPYTQELKIFSTDGVLSSSILLSVDAVGLTRLNQFTYLFCDRKSGIISAINIQTGSQTIFLSNPSVLQRPVDVLYRDGKVDILDAGRSSIITANVEGVFLNEIRINGNDSVDISNITSFAVDSPRGRYYLLDQVRSCVWAVDTNGNLLSKTGSFGSKSGQITRGGEIAVDQHGRLFVSDRFQGRVSVFSSDGKLIDTIRVFESSTSLPTGMAIDSNDVLYVVSTEGAGIGLYYVPPMTSPDEVATLSERLPADGSLLRKEDLLLRATARLNLQDAAISFDFQLFDDSSSSVAIEEQFGVLPKAESSTNQSFLFAEWTPQSELEIDSQYFWRVRMGWNGTQGVWSSSQSFSIDQLPLEYQLNQNYPNPFNPSTQISFSLPEETFVSLEVFNLVGRRVAIIIEEGMSSGAHTVTWNGEDDQGRLVSTGVYFYRLKTEQFVDSRKMILLK